MVTWTDRTGHPKHVTGKILDCSEHGMCLELPESIQDRTQLFLRAEKEKLVGGASVRYCRRSGARFTVGVEFNQGVRWKVPVPAQNGLPGPSPSPVPG